MSTATTAVTTSATTTTLSAGARLAGEPIRVGLMVPINNTTMEGELLGWLPEGSTVRTLRIPRGKGLLTEETLPAYKEAAVELAQKFNESPVDVSLGLL